MNIKVDTYKEDNYNTISTTFTLPELWMLSDKIRHESEDEKGWNSPPTSSKLNEAISLAIYVCETFNLSEYTLLLTFKDLNIIDYNIRRTDTTPEGAKGKTILLKCYEGLYNLLFKNTETPSNADKVFTPSMKKRLGSMLNDSSSNKDTN